MANEVSPERLRYLRGLTPGGCVRQLEEDQRRIELGLPLLGLDPDPAAFADGGGTVNMPAVTFDAGPPVAIELDDGSLAVRVGVRADGRGIWREHPRVGGRS